jgi:glucose-6-phosphate 1-dehydrogenase
MAGLLPTNTHIVGYARSSLTSDNLREKLRPYLSGGDEEEKAAFLSICSYLSGPYDAPDGYQNLGKLLKERESCHCSAGRLFYLALPPNTFASVCDGLKQYCDDIQGPPESSWIRVIVEKPFGRDLMSSELLANDIGAHYPENQLYRIDHYLGKEMVQNLLLMRFANTLLSPVWNKDNIANVQITFKEDIGTQGRGGYFDEYGIIRDVIQNHLMQLVCFVAMEKVRYSSGCCY